MDARPIPPVVAIPVAVVSTLLSAVLGFFATLLYRLEGPAHLPPTGLALGAVTGALAAMGWVAWMQRRSLGCRRASFVLRGVAGGILVGSLASIVLHAGIALAAPTASWWIGQLVGQGFAVVTGAILGLAGGAGWNHHLPPPT